MPARRLTAIAILLVLALAGCGGPSDEEKIRMAIRDYYGAFAAGNGEKACAQLADATRDEFTLRSKAPGCPAAIEKAAQRPDVKPFAKRLANVSIQSVEVHGKTATAQVSAIGASTEVPLVKEGEEWKIKSGPEAPGRG